MLNSILGTCGVIGSVAVSAGVGTIVGKTTTKATLGNVLAVKENDTKVVRVAKAIGYTAVEDCAVTFSGCTTFLALQKLGQKLIS